MAGEYKQEASSGSVLETANSLQAFSTSSAHWLHSLPLPTPEGDNALSPRTVSLGLCLLQ